MTEGLPKHLLFLKNIYFKILTICHHIFTFTAHGRRVRILKIRLIKVKVLKQIKRRRSKPSQPFYTSQLHGEKQGKKEVHLSIHILSIKTT